MQGQLLAHFRLQSLLGVGGMGEVWAADDTRLGRRVAIKPLPETFTRDPGRLARFEREARTLAALNHPSIASEISHSPTLRQPMTVEGAILGTASYMSPEIWAFGVAGRVLPLPGHPPTRDGPDRPSPSTPDR